MPPPLISMLRILLNVHLLFTLSHCEDELFEFSDKNLAENQQLIRESASKSLDNLNRQQIQRFEQQGQALLALPEDDNWSNSIIISKQTWQIFEASLGMESSGDRQLDVEKMGDSPVYYLMLATKDLTAVVSQAQIVSGYIASIDRMPDMKGPEMDFQFAEMVLEYWTILNPIFGFPDIKSPEGKVTEAILGKGKYLDTGFGISPLWMKAQLRKLLSYEEVATNTVLVSDTKLLQTYMTLNRVRIALGNFLGELQTTLLRIREKYPKSKDMSIAVEWPAASTEGFGRQDIGYYGWYNRKYIHDFDSRRAPGMSDTGQATGEPFLKWATSKRITFDMYLATLFLLNKVFAGLLPLMMEMLLDIMLASNIFLGRRSIYPDYEFGIPWKLIKDRGNAIAWLETYPEVNTNDHVKLGPNYIYKPSPTEFNLPDGQHDIDPLAPDYISIKHW